MQVAAVSTPGAPGWRWRIVNYAGETVEESHRMFPTIAAAVADGSHRLAELDLTDRSAPPRFYRSLTRPRGRPPGAVRQA